MTIQQSAQVAAQWWSQKLVSGKKFDDLGSSERDKGMAIRIGLLDLVHLKAIPIDQIGEFEAQLAMLIIEEWEDQKCWKMMSENLVILNVDYHAVGLLANAGDLAGLSNLETQFPRKTVMWVGEASVKVAVGYGGEVATLHEETADD